MRKIVIIPARGGSKRIPKKNIKEFFGKPIIAYSLLSGVDAEIFEYIHVSTEDQEIYNLVSDLGFRPEFYRTNNNASDDSPVKDVLIEVIQKFDEQDNKFDIICLLSATAPLINGADLKDAYSTFKNLNMQHPLLAVTRYPVPVEWALQMDERNFLEPLNNELFFKSSHDFQDKYYDIGSFAFFTRDQLFSQTSDVKFMPYVLPENKSVDVDNMQDWKTLEKNYFLQNNIFNSVSEKASNV